MTWPFYNHRTLAEVDADAILADDTLSRSPSDLPAKSVASRIVAIHRTYPDWGATRIAIAVGRSDAYVRAVAIRKGVKLPRSEQGAYPSAGRDYMRNRRAG